MMEKRNWQIGPVYSGWFVTGSILSYTIKLYSGHYILNMSEGYILIWIWKSVTVQLFFDTWFRLKWGCYASDKFQLVSV